MTQDRALDTAPGLEARAVHGGLRLHTPTPRPVFRNSHIYHRETSRGQTRAETGETRVESRERASASETSVVSHLSKVGKLSSRASRTNVYMHGIAGRSALGRGACTVPYWWGPARWDPPHTDVAPIMYRTQSNKQETADDTSQTSGVGRRRTRQQLDSSASSIGRWPSCS